LRRKLRGNESYLTGVGGHRSCATPNPDYNPMIPQVIVLQPGLVIYKVDNGDWFFARRTLEDLPLQSRP
jgi:hypothetical protein